MPEQAYKSGRLLASGDGKPHSVSMRQCDGKDTRCERGESVALSTDEVSAQQLDVTLHGCRGCVAVEGTPQGDPVACSPCVSNLGNSRLEEMMVNNQSEAASVDCTAEDMVPGARARSASDTGATENPTVLRRAQELVKGIMKKQGKSKSEDLFTGPLTIDDSIRRPDTLVHAISWRDESHPQWVKIRTVMNSGAAQDVAPPSMAPGVVVEESSGFKRG